MFPSRLREAGIVCQLAAVLLGTVAVALSAKVQVPSWPVPVTMQSLVVILVAAAAGRRLGATVALAYLAAGAVRLPIFSGSTAGPEAFTGPTAGYLLGFLPAAYGVGWLSERGWCHSPRTGFPLMVIGHVLILLPGALWLAHLLGAERAIGSGLLPFLLGTALKSVAGACVIELTPSPRLPRPVDKS